MPSDGVAHRQCRSGAPDQRRWSRGQLVYSCGTVLCGEKAQSGTLHLFLSFHRLLQRVYYRLDYLNDNSLCVRGDDTPRKAAGLGFPTAHRVNLNSRPNNEYRGPIP